MHGSVVAIFSNLASFVVLLVSFSLLDVFYVLLVFLGLCNCFVPILNKRFLVVDSQGYPLDPWFLVSVFSRN